MVVVPWVDRSRLDDDMQRKDEFLLVKQEIIMEAIRIVCEAGGRIGTFG